MPDRYGDSDTDIANCHLCDADGYRGSTVCDHIDHAEASKRGMAAIRDAMGWTP